MIHKITWSAGQFGISSDIATVRDKVFGVGLGDTKPISDNFTQEGKANNRRVEFVRQ